MKHAFRFQITCFYLRLSLGIWGYFVLSNTATVHFFWINNDPFLLRPCQKCMTNRSTWTKEALFIITCCTKHCATVLQSVDASGASSCQTSIWIAPLVKADCDSDGRNCSSKTLRPPPEGLCQPSTPPLLRCQEDAQPASPWTQTENPAHCCYGHWGWHWCPLPRRPALHGGTSRLNKG